MDTTNILLQWKRTKSDGGLELWVNETGRWVHYKLSKCYVADSPVSSQSGFQTGQRYLKLGSTYAQITPEDYKIPEESDEV